MNTILKLEPYDPDAQDGDGDGIVQEGTAWERPAGTRLLLQSGLEVVRGETSTARPQGLRSVGSDGREVPHTPSWMRGQTTLTPVAEPKTSLSDVGVRSLKESGFPDVRTLAAPSKPQEQPDMQEKPEVAKIPDRDWDDFSDLSGNDLAELQRNLRDQMDEALDGDDENRVKDLRKKLRKIADESKLRMIEESRNNAVKRENAGSEMWEKMYADRFGELGKLKSKDFDQLLEAATLLRQQQREAVDNDVWDQVEAIEHLRDVVSGHAAKIISDRAETIKKTVDAGLGGKSSDELADLLDDVEVLLEDVTQLGYFQDKIADDLSKTRQQLMRRISAGGQPEKTPVAKEKLGVVFDGITPRAVDKRRPALTELADGELLPVPKQFGLDESGNPKFTKVEDAARHVADGGALEDVPNEFWADVLAANSSEDIDDPSTKFYGVSGGGGIADTQIYLIRNPDGTLGNQGYVVKTASPKDNLGEMIGFNLAVAHGLNTEGAVWDGDTPWGRSVVLPHAFNAAPDGEIQVPDYYDYQRGLLEGAVDGGMPQALAHFLHNYVLGISDRHAGNGMMMRVGDQVVIVPIDQGWIGQSLIAQPLRETDDAGLIDINSYASEFRMHTSILDDVSTHAKRANLSEEEAQKYAEKIIAVYDDMLERIESVVDQGRGAWHQYTPEAPEDAKRYFTDTADMFFDSYEKRSQLLRDSRDAILDRLLVPSDEALAKLDTDSEFDLLDDLESVVESPIVWSGRG
jgi:hypothetical protein